MELVVPYKGRQLKGDELVRQLKKWASYGTIEPSAAEAIEMVNNQYNTTSTGTTIPIFLIPS